MWGVDNIKFPILQAIELVFLFVGGAFAIFEYRNWGAAFLSCVSFLRMDYLHKATNGYHVWENYFHKFSNDNGIVGINGLFQKIFCKRPSSTEIVKNRLDNANKLANIISSTNNFEEFVNSYGELIINMEFLQSIENLSFFSVRKPSEDLREIREIRPLTEKEFIDRYIYQHGKEKLLDNKIYFDKLLPETVQYINSFLKI